MANGLIVPDPQNPGSFIIPALGKRAEISQLREGDVYDSGQVASGAISAGTEIIFFSSVTDKNLQHKNFNHPGRVPAGMELAVNRIGLVVAQAQGNTMASDDDVIKIAYSGALKVKINERTIAEGPAFTFQSGYGVVGSTTRTDTGVVTIGMPSFAAAPQLLVVQPIRDDDDLAPTLTWPNNAWITSNAMPPLDGRTVLTILLHGVVKTPLGK